MQQEQEKVPIEQVENKIWKVNWRKRAQFTAILVRQIKSHKNVKHKTIEKV
jgi:hypothetical protein